jgi:hypothetical protein
MLFSGLVVAQGLRLIYKTYHKSKSSDKNFKKQIAKSPVRVSCYIIIAFSPSLILSITEVSFVGWKSTVRAGAKRLHYAQS